MSLPESDRAALLPQPFHALAPADALAALSARRSGLGAPEIESRRQRYGVNALPEPKGKTALGVFLAQFMSPFIYLLFAAAIVSVALRELADAGFILAVLLTNALIGAVQEWRAETRGRALRQLVRGYASVVRDGRTLRVDIRELVPGDIVVLETGLRVPADIRLLEAHRLLVDESLLTGESLPTEKSADAVLPPDCPLGDRATVLHAGTTLLQGRGVGVVTATGLATEIGRIAAGTVMRPAPQPPLIRQMARFTRALTIFIVGSIALLAIVEIGRGTAPGDIFLVAVALAVSAIPEGLPVAMTIALSVAVNRMARRNVVVRNLPAVEGLGACTLIATDKTGTLTLNKLTVDRLWLPGIGECDAGQPQAEELAFAAAVCNEAVLGDGGNQDGAVGDSVDVAFLVQASRFGITDAASRDPDAGAIPYEPELKFAAAFRSQGGVLTAYVKGAPEAVLPMCDNVTAETLQAAPNLAAAGFRVIAVASGPVGGADAGNLTGLRFHGFAGLIDPLRPEAAAAVARARAAGVQVRMITGDHPLTALAIARRLGLSADSNALVTGAHLARLSGEAFDKAVADAQVYARIEPMQKLAIVEALRKAGHVVAMTGDGVNDAPALRAADIGVAMAQSGTDVAREAADLLLVDDNFASIVAGIEEGRFAYDNLRKVIALSLSTGAAEIGLFALATLFDLPIPLTAVQLLWLNLVTNGIQDVALAFERGEPDALARRPRPPGRPIIDRRMIEQTVLPGLLMSGVAFFAYWWQLQQGLPHAAAQNAVLWMLVCFENAHCLNCRSETRSIVRIPLADNPLLLLGILGAQLAQIAAMYMPGVNEILGIAPLPLDQWALLALVALSVVPAMEIYKMFRRISDRREAAYSAA